MDAMRSHPENGSAFERQGSANGEEIFERARQLIRTMRVQPVVAHADAQPDGHPIKNDRGDESAPTEHKQSSDGAHVQNNQNADNGPVQFPVFINSLNFSQEDLPECPNP